jgi:hypothetical protein
VRGLPSELREFIASKFSAPGQLDVFMLLYREAARSWSPAEVASALGIAMQTADMRLFLLASASLLTPESGAELRYSYAASPTLDRFARLLLEAYEADPQALEAVITGEPPSDPVKQLADAFKLRKP